MPSRRPPVPKGSVPKAAVPKASAGQTETARAKPAETTAAAAAGTGRSAAPRSKPTGASRGSKPVGSKAAAEPVAAKSFSGRLVALIVVLLAVTVMLTPSVNTFLQQRSEIAALRADIAAKQQQQQDLKDNLSKWSDPAYIKQQARDRVSMMMPGETGYWVYGGDAAPATPEQPGTSVNPEGLPWVDGLWQSITRSANE